MADGSWVRVERERVEIESVDAAARFDEEVAERRERLVERVLGPEDEEEGAAEEASARFLLRVSIQKPKPSNRRVARHRAAITQFLIQIYYTSEQHQIKNNNKGQTVAEPKTS